MQRGITGFLFAAILLSPLISGQQTPTAPSAAPAYENGALTDNLYSNECLGFSYPIPAGWHVNTQMIGADATAKHLPGGGLALLVVDREKDGALADRIVLTARDAGSGSPPTAQEFVSNSVRAQINADQKHREALRDVHAVDYAGKHFFRSEYKQTGERTVYSGFVYTKFRGHYLGATLIAGSAEELEEAANSLQRASFREDERNAKCVDTAAGAPATASAQRIRVSEKVSQGLLIKSVNPPYPEEARHGHIQGQVVLKVLIDMEGNVESVSLVSGHPLLAPPAIEAVKQWKYKPFLLEGKPSEVETQIVVNFTLSGG